jgi:hypothetical protein
LQTGGTQRRELKDRLNYFARLKPLLAEAR